MQELEFEARIVFLCASAIESTRILLNSRNSSFPDGLANSSGTLGRYVMDHDNGAGAGGQVPGFMDRRTLGRRPNGIYVPRFRNVKTPHQDFLRGYGFQGGSGRSDWSRAGSMLGYGVGFKQALIHELGPWSLSLVGFGEMLPHADNRITLDPSAKDKWGIPAARIDVRWRENELEMREDMRVSAAEMMEAVGCKDIVTMTGGFPPGHSVHEMGGARMSRTPSEGVLNGWNQAWDVPNLFVTDGACMASSACQNPSMTYMALTARAAAHAVDEMKAGAL